MKTNERKKNFMESKKKIIQALSKKSFFWEFIKYFLYICAVFGSKCAFGLGILTLGVLFFHEGLRLNP